VLAQQHTKLTKKLAALSEKSRKHSPKKLPARALYLFSTADWCKFKTYKHASQPTASKYQTPKTHAHSRRSLFHFHISHFHNGLRSGHGKSHKVFIYLHLLTCACLIKFEAPEKPPSRLGWGIIFSVSVFVLANENKICTCERLPTAPIHLILRQKLCLTARSYSYAWHMMQFT